MSDREQIIHFLEKAEKRVRSNKRFNDIAVTLAIAFVFPVVFKLLDLLFLFRGRTVVTVLGLWAIATIVWIILKLRGRSPLNQVAGSIDSKARLNDQLKTAYWFIQNPRESKWVDAQIRHTASAAGKLSLDTLFPRRFPRASYLVGGLLFAMVLLNFIPVSLNYNWLAGHAAPPFRLTDEERKSLQNALKLLEKAKAAENALIAEQIQNVIDDLEQGNISQEEAMKQLQELQERLEEGELDAENMTNGLAQMAAILRQSKALQAAAQQMGKGALDEASSQVQVLNARLEGVSPAEIQEMADKLQLASERPRTGLQDLARAFQTTSAALQRGDRTAGHSGLDRIARELKTLADELADQELRSKAGDEIGDLIEALEDSDAQEIAGESTQTGKPSGQSKAGQPTASEAGEAEQQAGEAPEQVGEGEPVEGGEQGGEGGEAGENPGGTSDDAADGKGGNSFGGSTKSAPLEGEATALEVQLQKEALKIEPGQGEEPAEEIEAAGERERSKLDYRNAPSNLTPAQKDLLNQDRIPWQSRQLIKNYFQAVKPATQTK
jgi:polyhydroxyalkanoate synthesis regulator phasin